MSYMDLGLAGLGCAGCPSAGMGCSPGMGCAGAGTAGTGGALGCAGCAGCPSDGMGCADAGVGCSGCAGLGCCSMGRHLSGLGQVGPAAGVIGLLESIIGTGAKFIPETKEMRERREQQTALEQIRLKAEELRSKASLRTIALGAAALGGLVLVGSLVFRRKRKR